MKKGEKGILIGIAVFAIIGMSFKSYVESTKTEKDPGIPFYSTATKTIEKSANQLIRKYNCRACHVLWAQRTIMQSVPAPSLDGIGSLRAEKWLYDYLSAEDPQSILPSRLKQEFKMPSFANMADADRKILASYLSGLKVEDWYLEETKEHEYSKLTGKDSKVKSKDD
jgi:hypothetical protein